MIQYGSLINFIDTPIHSTHRTLNNLVTLKPQLGFIPTHQYRLQPCVFNIYISRSLVWSKRERQKHVIQA